MRTQERRGPSELTVVGSGTRGPLEPARLLGHATAALHMVVAAVPGTAVPGAAASDALGACYLDLWICDRLLRHDGGDRSAAARCLLPVLLLEGVGGIAPVLGARLHRPDAVAVEYRRRRRLLVRAVRERSPLTWEGLGHRLARVAAGDDRLARPLTAVRDRGLPQPLAELVGLLEAERRELVAAGIEPAGQEPPRGLLERCALLTAAAACLDGWQEAGAHPAAPRQSRWAPGPFPGLDGGEGAVDHRPLTAPVGVSLRRARLCGALYRLAVRLDLRSSDVARTAWRADVLRCAVA